MTMLKDKELTIFLISMANQLDAGLTIVESVENLIGSFESHKEQLSFVAARMKEGHLFSSSIHDFLPDDMHAPIKVGEESGSLPEVFRGLQCHHDMFSSQMRKAKSELIKPSLVLLAAICAFVGFMLVIFPMNAKALPPAARNEGVFWLSNQFVSLYESAPYVYLIPPVGLVLLAVYIAQSDEMRSKLLDMAFHLPIYGHGMKLLYWSSWANYVSLAVKAGLIHTDAISMTNKMLPVSMQAEFDLLLEDLNNGDWAKAADPSHWSETDGRHDWPLMLRIALKVGGPQGTLDELLSKSSLNIMVDAETKIGRGVSLASTIAFSISVICVVSLAVSLILAQSARFVAS